MKEERDSACKTLREEDALCDPRPRCLSISGAQGRQHNNQAKASPLSHATLSPCRTQRPAAKAQDLPSLYCAYT